MTHSDSNSNPELSEGDRAEIQRLTERSNSMNRRGFLRASGKALSFALPAIATFTISADALGSTGSSYSSGGMGGHGMGSMGGHGMMGMM